MERGGDGFAVVLVSIGKGVFGEHTRGEYEGSGGEDAAEKVAAGEFSSVFGVSCDLLSSGLDGGADPLVGTAAADVACHGFIDVLSVGFGSLLSSEAACMIWPV